MTGKTKGRTERRLEADGDMYDASTYTQAKAHKPDLSLIDGLIYASRSWLHIASSVGRYELTVLPPPLLLRICQRDILYGELVNIRESHHDTEQLLP